MINAGPVLLHNAHKYSASLFGIALFLYKDAVVAAPTGNPQSTPSRMGMIITPRDDRVFAETDAAFEAIADSTIKGKRDGMTDSAQSRSASLAKSVILAECTVKNRESSRIRHNATVFTFGE